MVVNGTLKNVIILNIHYSTGSNRLRNYLHAGYSWSEVSETVVYTGLAEGRFSRA